MALVVWYYLVLAVVLKDMLYVYSYSKIDAYKEIAALLSYNLFKNETPILLVMLIVAILISKYKNKILDYLYSGTAALLFLMMFIDMEVFFSFFRRLDFMDLIKFSEGGHQGGLSEFAVKYTTDFIIFATVLAMVIYIVRELGAKKPIKVTAALLIAVLFVEIRTDRFKTEYETKNVFAVNMHKDYAKENCNAKKCESDYDSSFKQTEGDGKKRSVILIFAESWSAIESQRTSEANVSNLKAYDEVTRKGRLLRNLFAEGSTTDEAYVTLFTGEPPIKYDYDSRSYAPYYDPKHNLIEALDKEGYNTLFVKAYTLQFLNLKGFLKNLGFKELYGRDEAFLDPSLESYIGGVPDDTVYDFSLKKIKEQKEPFFMAITTLSTHPPFDTPLGRDKESAFKYSAEAFKRFYERLEASGYLKDNYLILMGDHREMAPLIDGELTRYGKEAYARVTGAIWGGDTVPNTIDDNYYNQRDISYSILGTASETPLLPKQHNNVFKATQQREYCLHCGYENRSYVQYIERNGKGGEVHINGSESSLVQGDNREALRYVVQVHGSHQARSKNE